MELESHVQIRLLEEEDHIKECSAEEIKGVLKNT